jgi:hypothetical protein
LYCEECGASLRTDGPGGEYKEEIAGLNKQLAKAANKNAQNRLEIARLKRELNKKEEEIIGYIAQNHAGAGNIEKAKGQGGRGCMIAVLVIIGIAILFGIIGNL